MYVAFFQRIWICSTLKEQPRPKKIRREISTKKKPSREIIHHFFAGNILYHVCLTETHLRRNVWRKILTKRYQERTFCLYQTKILHRSVPPFLCCKTLPNTSIFKGHPYREMFQEKNTTRRYRKRTISQKKSLQRHFSIMFFRQRFYTANFLRKHPYQKMWKKEIQPKHIRREISTKQNLSETLSSTTCVSKKHIYGAMFGDKSPRKDIRKELSVSTKQKLYRDLFHLFFVEETLSNTIIFKGHPYREMFQEKNTTRRYQKRTISQTKSLQKPFSTSFLSRDILYHELFEETPLPKNVRNKSDQKISEEKTPPSKPIAETFLHHVSENIEKTFGHKSFESKTFRRYGIRTQIL